MNAVNGTAGLPDFDISSIPVEFNPLTPLDGSNHQYAGDDKLFVQFRTDPVLNPFKSTQAGRAIYDEVDMVIIRTPGSQLTTIIAPAKHYMNRFGDKYNRWKANQNEQMSGTPLEAFPFLIGKVGMQAELKAMNVHTVEQLAGLADVHKQKLMGGQELCRRAAEWLDSTTGTDAQLTRLSAENEQLQSRLQQLEAFMASQQQVMQTAQEVKKEPAKATATK